MHKVLFICTGNFYRSRFAEALLNYHATARNLPARAFSRGLAIHLAEGDLSAYTAAALAERGIDFSHTGETRVSLKNEDLLSADTIIALDEIEHRPLMQSLFPDWAERITYWNCRDIQWEASVDCIPRIEQRVMNLLEEIGR
ncbi:MAG: low molecular weight phosphatase family protein [Opitutales bacterium]|nr:low molecular weight phosphatase family protein [Opitutales bacterium]